LGVYTDTYFLEFSNRTLCREETDEKEWDQKERSRKMCESGGRIEMQLSNAVMMASMEDSFLGYLTTLFEQNVLHSLEWNGKKKES
jgi:hypothetical protein